MFLTFFQSAQGLMRTPLFTVAIYSLLFIQSAWADPASSVTLSVTCPASIKVQASMPSGLGLQEFDVQTPSSELALVKAGVYSGAVDQLAALKPHSRRSTKSEIISHYTLAPAASQALTQSSVVCEYAGGLARLVQVLPDSVKKCTTITNRQLKGMEFHCAPVIQTPGSKDAR